MQVQLFKQRKVAGKAIKDTFQLLIRCTQLLKTTVFCMYNLAHRFDEFVEDRRGFDATPRGSEFARSDEHGLEQIIGQFELNAFLLCQVDEVEFAFAPVTRTVGIDEKTLFAESFEHAFLEFLVQSAQPNRHVVFFAHSVDRNSHFRCSKHRHQSWFTETSGSDVQFLRIFCSQSLEVEEVEIRSSASAC